MQKKNDSFTLLNRVTANASAHQHRKHQQPDGSIEPAKLLCLEILALFILKSGRKHSFFCYIREVMKWR
ncbi:MAG: hypothetical protein ISR54_08015 [Chlorobium phaeobacteroides]|uniref:Uncharacterized protein n=1 Tax=Chlorobium phaeobacteroides (strain BS1) TaxID=331678 RepID=B3EPD5_CHLPB|nr:hypothetical protein [Chlorobium phaeobacteroides]MBL6956740.1 hypothetical protein [Chlorobium phaeobacteroides]